MKANEFDLLLRRLDEGDESALVDIYNAYGKKIIGVAISIVGDIQHAQAVLDDVLVLLWNKSKKFNNIVRPDALIYDLARKSNAGTIKFGGNISSDVYIQPVMGQIIGTQYSGALFGNTWTGNVDTAGLSSDYHGFNQTLYARNAECGKI